MSFSTLIARSLAYFWRLNGVVVFGVAVAVGILTGALVVGDSVRESLRTLFLERLGQTDEVVFSKRFFRVELANELRRSQSVFDAVPIIAFEGIVSHEISGRRSTRVQVYGIDEKFLRLNQWNRPEIPFRDGFITDQLARELNATEGEMLLLSVEKPTSVPASSLHGEKENIGRTLRLRTRKGFPEFSIYPQQQELLAIYVPLERLQRELNRPGRANTILIVGSGREALEHYATLDDLGVVVTALPDKVAVNVESDTLIIGNKLAQQVESVASSMGLRTVSLFTYLANKISAGQRETPYSLVTALDSVTYGSLLGDSERLRTGIILNEWLASDLKVAVGEAIDMDFYVWEKEGKLVTDSTDFVVNRIVPIQGFTDDQNMAPHFPGISEANSLSDWDPPFPVEYGRLRPKDERYWDLHRTTPKAFIPLESGQALWPVRQGNLTSIRVLLEEGQNAEELTDEFRQSLRTELDVIDSGIDIVSVRKQGIIASSGSTDFGEYFIYFSYFIIISALLLTGLFFKLGIEQRLREVGTLLGMGFSISNVRRLFLFEGVVLSVLGGVCGSIVALGYSWVVMHGLRTWWVDAVGTRLLTLSISPVSFLLGFAGGVTVTIIGIALTLRGLRGQSVRQLLVNAKATIEVEKLQVASRRAWIGASIAIVLAVGLVVLSAADLIGEVAGFLGAGNLLLLALLIGQWIWFRSKPLKVMKGLSQLGFRNVSSRPVRSLVAIALVAFATFIIVSVEGFRKDDDLVSIGSNSGSGGYPIVGESLVPIYWNPNSLEGREQLNLPMAAEGKAALDFINFRLRPGDDASCLNLYRPLNPRVLAPSDEFLQEGGFSFVSSLASTLEEKANPWLLLQNTSSAGIVPFIGDAKSMKYVLHLEIGDDFLLPRTGMEPIRLRLVGILRDSIFQSELIISEANFMNQFPDHDGFRFFLVDGEGDVNDLTIQLLEKRLVDYGFDAQLSAERLAGFHRVENTFLTTFQSLGGLGLILGTIGLAAIMLRNILEQRRELALLRAVGYSHADFFRMVLSENMLILMLGIMTGTISAIVAIAPALASRGGVFVTSSLGLLLLSVVGSGVFTSIVAIRATLVGPILTALRSE